MFEYLASRLEAVIRRLRGRGKLTEADVDTALREVRLALLEADVNYRVVKDFVARLRERAVGDEVLHSLTPGQQVVKIVHEELSRLLGEAPARLAMAPAPPTVVMLVGLQGSGKTTTAGKLAWWLKGQGRQPLLVALDVRRPAAMEQLSVVARQAGAAAYVRPEGRDPVALARDGVAEARAGGRDVVVLDTAGRLHVDDELMAELVRVKQAVRPHEVLLVLDAMTGQDAVALAEGFAGRVGIDGVILTKLDGDARGGAALSVRAVTGVPIKFAGVGERLEALEPFHPDRMASRILGMGDVLSLIEKAQAAADAEQIRAMEERLRTARFTLEDFLDQLRQVRKLGPLEQVLGMLPGGGPLKQVQGMALDPKALDRVEAIINSMTPQERRNPDLIDGSRRRRIARGSGTQVQDVNRLLRQYQELRQLLKRLSALEAGGRRGRLRLPFP